MLTRRTFLKSASLLALAPTAPGFLIRSARAALPDPDGRVLVVVELSGGNDGINTVVPYADEGYARHRRHLRIPRDRLLRVDDRVGCTPRSETRPGCWRTAGWRSYKGSATPTRAARTSKAWRSGRPPG